MSNDLLPEVNPYAFISVGLAAKYIRRGDLSTDDGEEPELWCRAFINSTTAVIEAKTGRPLAARSYRTEISGSYTLADGSAEVVGDTAVLRERDELAGDGIPIGSIIDSIDDATHFTMSKKASETGAKTLTFGFGPLVCDGRPGDVTREGYQILQVPEYPVQALHSVSYRDAAGALTAVDITGARIDRNTGRVVLPVGYLPSGDQNIEIECVAGYLPPRAGRIQGFNGWHDLAWAQARMVKIGWSDFLKGFGRTANIQFGEVNEFINDYRWPADIDECFKRHRRMW